MDRDERFSEISTELGDLDPSAFDEYFDESPDAALELLAKMTQATDRQLAALSRKLAGRLVLDLARTGRARSRGVGRLVTARANESSSDLDIDASLEGLVAARSERRPPAIDELMATQWERPHTAICLLIDRSGSMNGERLASAALAAAVCAWRAPKDFAVVAFSSRAVEMKGLGVSRPPEDLVSEVLSLQGRGTTDVRMALRAANNQLRGSRAKRQIVILLSDSEVTKGGDPVSVARSLQELVILAPRDEPEHAQDLARRSGARLAEVGGPMSVLDALRQVVQRQDLYQTTRQRPNRQRPNRWRSANQQRMARLHSLPDGDWTRTLLFVDEGTEPF